jgi:hypothetical protein
MERKILESCPTCGGEFAITELTCNVCETVVRSRYSPCPFCRLSPEDLAFMLLFIRHRGNVKDMERELGVSYWTIRGRLNELIASMGLEPAGEDETPEATPVARPPTADRRLSSAARQKILERLKAGEISAEEAARELRVTSDE